MKFFTMLVAATGLTAMVTAQAVDGDLFTPDVNGGGLDASDPGGDTEVTPPPCNVDNCITCYETDMCQSCETGYSANHNGGDGSCAVCEITDCGVCDDDASQCTQCVEGFYMESFAAYTTTPLPEGVTGSGAHQTQTCTACTIDGCGECYVDDDGAETCDACALGYFQADDGTCVACGTNCDECAATDSNGNVGGCLQCADLWEPELDGSCGEIGSDCGTNCDVCEEHNQCKTCADGYSVQLFNSGLSSGCAPCPPNCASCADAETCDVCEDTYIMDDVSGSCATQDEVYANVCDCRVTANDGCTCPGDEGTAKDGCCDAGGMCGGTDGVCSLYNSDVCSDYDNCAYCFGQSFCGSCDVGYYKTAGHPWGACIALPTGWDLTVCDVSKLYNDQCECGCGAADPECVEHKVDNCEGSDSTTGAACDADGVCADCTLTGCAFCENGDDQSTCFECFDGYDLSDDASECVLCDIDGCASCQTGIVIDPDTGNVGEGVTCKSCFDGYYGDIADGTCTACVADDCEQCSADTCNKCMDGFSLDSVEGTCSSCSANCLQCGASQCNRCETGYEIVDGACTETGLDCGFNCASCGRGGQCKICDAGYYVGAGTNGKCVSCIDDCAACRDGDSCTTCDDGYNYDINEFACLAAGECLADICDCRNYDASDLITGNAGCTCLENEATAKFDCCNSDCGLCADMCADYADAPCTDFDNCNYCFGQTYCMECADGYFQADYHGDCIALPDGWDTDLCEITKLNDNVCDCGCGGYDPDCDEWPAEGCASGQYCSSDAECSDCALAGCDHCANGIAHETDTGECLECTDGHYIDEDGNCFDCSLEGCATCLLAGGNDAAEGTTSVSPNEFSCKACADGYYMDNLDLCKACDITNCAVCALDGSCEECDDAYSLSSTGACTGCIDNCIDCTGDVDSCKRCDDNWEVLDDGTCGEVDNDCGTDCDVCGAGAICKSCKDTFYKDSSSECASCMDNCKDCTSSTGCSTCSAGYGFRNSICETYSDSLEYCDTQIKDNLLSAGTLCECEGWECAAVDTTTTTIAVRGRK